MATTLEELVITLTAETSGLRAELANGVQATQDAAASMESALANFTKNSTDNISGFESALATMAGVVGGELVLGAIKKLAEAAEELFTEFSRGVDGAAAEEQAFTRLANALAQNNQYSAEALKSFQAFSVELEHTTGVTTEASAASLALLATLTKLDTDGLKKAEQAAVDLAAVMNTDLQSATSLIARGIEGNTEIFKRHGIEIQAGSSESENFANITSKIAEIAGGAATGAMQTYTGAVKQVNESYDEYMRQLGQAVTQNPVVIELLHQVSTAFQGLTEDMGGNKAIAEGLGIALITIVQALKDILIVTGEIVDHLKILEAGFQSIILVISATGDAVNGIIQGFTKLAQFDFSTTEKAYDSLYATVTSKPMFKDMVTQLDAVGDAGANAFLLVDRSAAIATASVGNNLNATKALTAAEKEHLDSITAYAQALAKKTDDISASFAQQLSSQKASYDAQRKNDTEYANLSDLTLTDLYSKQTQDDERYFASRKALIQSQYTQGSAAIKEAFDKDKLSETQYQAATLQLEKEHTLAVNENNKQQATYEKETQKERTANLTSTFGTIATLSESSNSTLAAIGKAAAISQATIDGYVAVQKALASAPPPFNFALAALVGVATAENVAKIAGVGFKDGVDSVPGIGTEDNYPAVLAPGERVVSANANADLTAFLANQGGGNNQPVININFPNSTIIGDLKSSQFGSMCVQAINLAIRNGSTVGLLKK